MRHQLETVSALVALCKGNPPVTSGFPSQMVSNADFDVFFYISLSKRLNKRTRCQWFERQSPSLWRHFNEMMFGPWKCMLSHRTANIYFLLCFLQYILIVFPAHFSFSYAGRLRPSWVWRCAFEERHEYIDEKCAGFMWVNSDD